jgi:hypothetical protein
LSRLAFFRSGFRTFFARAITLAKESYAKLL